MAAHGEDVGAAAAAAATATARCQQQQQQQQQQQRRGHDDNGDGDEQAVFEAFAVCDFARAARLALGELDMEAAAAEVGLGLTAAEAPSTPLGAGAGVSGEEGTGGPVMLAFPGEARCPVALTEACSRTDQLAAVALQCGFELQREEEAAAVGRYYSCSAVGGVPFPVAMIWLQVCLAQGGKPQHEEVRRPLLALLHTLEAAILRPSSATAAAAPRQEEKGQDGVAAGEEGVEEAKEHATAATVAPAAAAGATTGGDKTGPTDGYQGSEPSAAVEGPVGGEEGHGDVQAQEDPASMYAQAAELLVAKLMLPRGEGPSATELLQRRLSPFAALGEGQRGRLLDACRADAARRRAAAAAGGGRGGRGKNGGRGRPSQQQQRGQQQQEQHLAGGGRRGDGNGVVAAPRASSSLGQRLVGGLAALLGGRGRSTQQQQLRGQGSARRWLLAVVGFVVLALGFHARRWRTAAGGPVQRTLQALASLVLGKPRG